ncbi:MAG: chorismate mutase family protein [Actinobacteria bacterium]|nr:chorismate mutase family protein [Actinomycetota bacterium]
MRAHSARGDAARRREGFDHRRRREPDGIRVDQRHVSSGCHPPHGGGHHARGAQARRQGEHRDRRIGKTCRAIGRDARRRSESSGNGWQRHGRGSHRRARWLVRKVATLSSLDDLRKQIDDIDSAIVELLAQRMEVCREVADLKSQTNTAVIQPQRVREVLTTRRQWAIDNDVDPDFVEQLFRILLSETHRIEVAHVKPFEKPSKVADVLASALDAVACRIDHVVVAVANLAAASTFLAAIGFAINDTDDAAIKVAEGGGVTVVLVGPGDKAVDAHLAEHGSGVQHIAIEVLNAGYMQELLRAANIPLLTDVVVDAHGHEQIFTVLDPATGVQLGFISRTGNRVPMSGQNVRALFRAIGDA